VSSTRSKPKRNITWPISQFREPGSRAADRRTSEETCFSSPCEDYGSGFLSAIRATGHRNGFCGLAHSSRNLTTIEVDRALTRLDETALAVNARPNRRDEDMSKHKLTNQNAADSGNQAGDKKSKTGGLDLSLTQIVGGALAAMTAAALGAKLSAAGTLVGAALASIIAAVAGTLYTASLRRTQDKVKTVFWTRQPNEVEEPTVVEILPDNEGHIAGQRSHLVAPEPVDPSPDRRKLNWKRVVVAALATFGIAAVSLTVFELATGRALSGGDGTTIQQVRESRSEQGSDEKNKAPAEEPTNRTTSDATEEPTAVPSEQAASPEPDAKTSAPTPEASMAPKATSSSSP
jgi:hypothetical protein